MKNRLSSRLRLTLSGVTLLTLLLMCALVFAGMYFQTTADNREQLRQQAAPPTLMRRMTRFPCWKGAYSPSA